jgi:hypothetical protein
MKCYENWFVAAADQTIEVDLKRREDVVGFWCFSSEVLLQQFLLQHHGLVKS